MRRELNDRNGVELSLVQLSSIRIEQLQRATTAAQRAEVIDDAKVLADEALQIWTEMDNRSGEAQGLLQLAELLVLEGQAASGAPLYARACVAARNSKDHQIVI